MEDCRVRRKSEAQLAEQARRVYSNINWNRSGAYARAYRVNRAYQNARAQQAARGLSNG